MKSSATTTASETMSGVCMNVNESCQTFHTCKLGHFTYVNVKLQPFHCVKCQIALWKWMSCVSHLTYVNSVISRMWNVKLQSFHCVKCRIAYYKRFYIQTNWLAATPKYWRSLWMWMSHVTFGRGRWDMSHSTEVCTCTWIDLLRRPRLRGCLRRLWMWISHVAYILVMARIDESWHVLMSHGKCGWDLSRYGVATISRLLKIVRLFCKRAT